MPDVTLTFGGAPMELLTSLLSGAVHMTAADMRYTLERQKTRILERTARGVDINGAPFAPYSNKGPYYYYPGRASKNRSGAASRVAKKTGGKKTPLGVKFTSYGDFKRSLGRSAVDLMGPTAPHMLQAIVVTASADEGKIGIYGPEADRAEGHNVGGGHLPRREFFGASAEDERLMALDAEELMATRLKDIIQ